MLRNVVPFIIASGLIIVNPLPSFNGSTLLDTCTFVKNSLNLEKSIVALIQDLWNLSTFNSPRPFVMLMIALFSNH